MKTKLIPNPAGRLLFGIANSTDTDPNHSRRAGMELCRGKSKPRFGRAFGLAGSLATACILFSLGLLMAARAFAATP